MSYLNSVTNPLQQTACVAPKATSNAKTMNIALWILQVLWGVFFCFTGFGKIMCYRADVWNIRSISPLHGSMPCRKACSCLSVSASFLEASA